MEQWFIYACITRVHGDDALIKVGITSKPLARFFAIHCGSPFPVDVALWCPAGDRSRAARIEAGVKKAFEEKNTRGEWFRFDLSSEADKEFFHNTIRRIYRHVMKKPLEWKKTPGKTIVKVGFEVRSLGQEKRSRPVY